MNNLVFTCKHIDNTTITPLPGEDMTRVTCWKCSPVHNARHARKAAQRLQTTIQVIFWGSIIVGFMIIADMIGRHLIEVLP
jgi:hypothetical protein